MGSEGYKLNESECVLKCDSSWCVSQAATATLPWPGKQDGEAALSAHGYSRYTEPSKHSYTYMHSVQLKKIYKIHCFFAVCIP